MGSVIYEQKINKTRNKSNDYFESLQYRQDMFAITHYHKRKHLTSYTRCSENHNIYVRWKSELNPQFEIWFSVLAPSGGVEKNSNTGAQLHIISYKSPQNIFLELYGLIDFRCAQTLAL